MKIMKTSDIMTKDVKYVHEDTHVSEIAHILIENNIGGVPVVNKEGLLVGIITEGDLVVRTAKLHYPTYIQFLDSLIYLESTKKYENELRKALATIAADLMTSEVVSVPPDTDIADLATLMFEKHVHPVPVTQDGKLVGIVSRTDLIKLVLRETAEGS